MSGIDYRPFFLMSAIMSMAVFLAVLFSYRLSTFRFGGLRTYIGGFSIIFVACAMYGKWLGAPSPYISAADFLVVIGAAMQALGVRDFFRRANLGCAVLAYATIIALAVVWYRGSLPSYPMQHAAFTAALCVFGAIQLWTVARHGEPSVARDLFTASLALECAVYFVRVAVHLLPGVFPPDSSAASTVQAAYIFTFCSAVPLTAVCLLVNKIERALTYEYRVLAHMNDASRRSRLMEQKNFFKSLSEADALTGVANRHKFDTVLADEYTRAKLENRPLTVMMIDIDHFKRYNDSHGHQAGDHCIKIVSDTLHALVASFGGTFARYGGDEFAAVLADVGAEEAQLIGNSMVDAVKNRRIPVQDDFTNHKCVTVSIGTASLHPAELSSAMLLQRADAALYQSKKHGRGKACSDAAYDVAEHSRS